MLTKSHQEVLVKLYTNYMINGNSALAFSDLKEIYISRISFYKAMKYLITSGLIKKTSINKEKTRVLYKLTLKGEILARIIVTLSDQPPEFRKLSMMLKF